MTIYLFSDELNDAFYDEMGPESDVSDEEQDGDSSEMELSEAKLYKVSDSSGEMEVSEIAVGPFQHEQLEQSVRIREI